MCMLHSLADCLTPLSLLEGFEKYVDSVIAGGLGKLEATCRSCDPILVYFIVWCGSGDLLGYQAVKKKQATGCSQADPIEANVPQQDDPVQQHFFVCPSSLMLLLCSPFDYCIEIYDIPDSFRGLLLLANEPSLSSWTWTLQFGSLRRLRWRIEIAQHPSLSVAIVSSSVRWAHPRIVKDSVMAKRACHGYGSIDFMSE